MLAAVLKPQSAPKLPAVAFLLVLLFITCLHGCPPVHSCFNVCRFVCVCILCLLPFCKRTPLCEHLQSQPPCPWTQLHTQASKKLSSKSSVCVTQGQHCFFFVTFRRERGIQWSVRTRYITVHKKTGPAVCPPPLFMMS